MPGSFSNAIITTAGAALLARVEAGQATMEVTKVAVGDGLYSAAERTAASLSTRTSLKAQKNIYTPSSATVMSEDSIKIKTIFSNYDAVEQVPVVTRGYFINELAVYCKENGGAASTEVLYCIAVTSGVTGNYMPAYVGGGASQIIQDIFLTVGIAATTYVNKAGAAFLATEGQALKSEVASIKTRAESNTSAIAALDTRVNGLIGSATPTPVATVAQMTDTSIIYVYTGSETGYTPGDWYYYDSSSSSWKSGGEYGAALIDSTLSQKGQAADAKKTGDEITSLKSVLYDRIIYVGKGNAYAEYTYDVGLKAGKTYRVFVNKWDTTGITVTTGYMFKLGYSDGGEITYKFEHYGNDSSVLNEYYDVTIPSDATDVLLAIGGRATGNAILTVEDAELYLNIENLQNTKVNQEDIIELITGHIPTVQKLVKKFVTYATIFDVMSFSAEAGRRYRIDVTNIDVLVGADIRIRVYNGTANVYISPVITGDIPANTKWTYYFNCSSTEVVTVQIYRSGLTEDATFSVGVQCDDDRRDIDKLDSEVSQVSADVNMNVSRNLVGPDVEVLYPVAPLKTGDVITASAFNPSGVTTWCHVRFHALDGTQIAYFQFDTGYTSAGRTVTLNLNDSTAHFISISRDCGSPLMVERGTKTDLIPHYTTNYEKYLNSKSNFGEFEIFLPEQAEIIRKNLATARMAKRLCFGHTSDNHSTVYPFICNIIDLSDAKFIVNTGDIVQDKYSDAYTNFPNMINAMTKPHYITLGNHDVYKAPSKGDIFTKYFSPIISHNEQSNLDKTYYSVDFADEGVKCIFLDPYDALDDYSASMNTIIAGKMSETQINWLLAQLDDALTNAMHVCIFVHLSPEIVGEREKKFFDINNTESRMATYSFITDVVDAFIDGTSVTFNYSGSSYTHTFASAGVFVGYFCGHMHCDCIGKLKTHNRQNSFSVTRPWQSPEPNTIKDGTYRHGSSKWGYSTFNYVVVDPNTRHVSIMRVLQQDTKYGFKRDFVTVEY